MAKQLGLGQGFGQGGAVDVDDGLVTPRRGRVHRAGDQLLARAGLAVNEHGEIRAGDQVDLAPQALDGRAGADHLAALHHGVAHEIAHHQAAVLGRVFKRGDELGGAQLGRG